MKLKKNSLTVNIWKYIILFSITMLSCLWIFQVVFLNKYYEISKTKSLKKASEEIVKEYKNNNYSNLDKISHDYGICIEVIAGDEVFYTSNLYNKGCLYETNEDSYRKDFQSSHETSKTYATENPKFKNKTMIYANKINDYTYTYASASLIPFGATTTILTNQLRSVTIIVLILSLIVGYHISKKISKPILDIEDKAKKVGEGEYDTVFNEKTGIDELNSLSKTLNTTSCELKKIDELKTDLLANVSHDLKTPLTMIKAYAEMVRDLTYKDKKKRTDNLNVIIEESDRLNLLVNDILDLSKLQATETPLFFEEFDLNDLINTVLNRYDILKEEGYKLEYQNKSGIIIKADKKRIEQVIYNLINNAINYTGDDKVVKIQIIDDKDKYSVEVIDTGKGIPKKELPLIWGKYYHSKLKHKRNLIGTGLGLCIVKNILINHGFTYGVKTKLNVGTNFYFEIPKIKDSI